MDQWQSMNEFSLVVNGRKIHSNTSLIFNGLIYQSSALVQEGQFDASLIECHVCRYWTEETQEKHQWHSMIECLMCRFGTQATTFWHLNNGPQRSHFLGLVDGRKTLALHLLTFQWSNVSWVVSEQNICCAWLSQMYVWIRKTHWHFNNRMAHVYAQAIVYFLFPVERIDTPIIFNDWISHLGRVFINRTDTDISMIFDDWKSHG